MEDFIWETIVETVDRHQGRTAYRTPLVGFTPASDPGFAGLQEAVCPGHLMPQDLLPGAKTVAAFFVPFDRELVLLQRKDPNVNRAWAEAYVETNLLIESVCISLRDALAGKGIKAAWQQPTNNFDRTTMISFWSHKHVAYLCGLGSFGRHQMLITASGCAGRFGSLVFDAALPEAAPALQRAIAGAAGEEFCLARRGRRCVTCIKNCPSGALTEQGLDKQRCFRYLREVGEQFSDLDDCHVCGKCATGPCALGIPGPD
jgi:epoxyqueuosine reductase QueG